MDKRSYNKRQVGTEKENLAAEYLKKKGYFIIEKNYRVRQGDRPDRAGQHVYRVH